MATPALSVRVTVRFRPLTNEERVGDSPDLLKFATLDKVRCELTPMDLRSVAQQYTFDRIFTPESNQEEVYEHIGTPILKEVFAGYNGTIFAYGQTGSGKTYSMFGSLEDAGARGLIPRLMSDMFKTISTDASGSEYTIQCSFMEIYNETINDLLNPDNANLKLRDFPLVGAVVMGLTEEYVVCEQDVYDLLQIGNANRTVASTRMNAKSSRSHSLFVVQMKIKSPEGSVKSSKLNLVDLAGSEKVKATGAEGQVLQEAKKINKSLSALGNCIKALTDAGREHIPYRDSKLTQILKESLGGNSKTTLLCTCSCLNINFFETSSTLKFAQRAKKIKNIVTVNETRSPEQLGLLVRALQAEVAELKAKLGASGSSTLYESAVDSGRLAQLEVLYSNLQETSAMEKETLTSQLASLRVQEEASNKKIVYLEQELALATEFGNSLEAEVVNILNQRKADRVAAQAEIDSLRTQIESIQQTFQEVLGTNAQLSQQIDESKQTVAELQRTLENLSHEKIATEQREKEARDTVGQLQLTIESMQQSQKMAEETESMLKQKIKSMEMENKELYDMIADLDKEMNELRITQTSLEQQLQSKTKEFDEAQVRTQQVTSQFEQRIAEQDDVVKDLRAQIQSSNSVLTQKEREETDLRDQLNTLTQQKTALDQVVAELNTRIPDLQKVLSTHEEESKAIRASHIEELDKLRHEIVQLREENSSVRQQNILLAEDNAKRSDVAISQMADQLIKEQLKPLNERLEALQSENLTLTEGLSRTQLAQQSLATAAKHNETMVTQLQESLQISTNEVDMHKAELLALKQSYAKLQTDFESSKTAKDAELVLSARLAEDRGKQVQAAEEESRHLRTQLRDMECRFAQHQLASSTSAQQFTLLSSRYAELQTEMETLKESNTALQKAVQEKQVREQSLSNTVARLESQMDELSRPRSIVSSTPVGRRTALTTGGTTNRRGSVLQKYREALKQTNSPFLQQAYIESLKSRPTLGSTQESDTDTTSEEDLVTDDEDESEQSR
eukprot:GILK01006815.1.p1 GENE.GILK01006815.1~~GILK01006815.1.p1  ORF type:complete len:1037 (-),score=248.81 GILK01006815.1:72-3131(-)